MSLSSERSADYPNFDTQLRAPNATIPTAALVARGAAKERFELRQELFSYSCLVTSHVDVGQMLQGRTALVDVSIVMAVRGPAPWLDSAITSVQAQEGVTWRLHVVLDGEDKEIRRRIRAFTGDIQTSVLPAGSGAARARNLGLTLAESPLLAVLDADDIWKPTHLRDHLRAFQDDSALVLRGTQAGVLDSTGRTLRRTRRVATRLIKHQLLFRNCFVHSSVAYLRAPVQQIGGYPEEVRIGEDYLLWMELASYGAVANSTRAQVLYRLHANQLSKSPVSHNDLQRIGVARLTLAQALGYPRPLFSVLDWSNTRVRTLLTKL